MECHIWAPFTDSCVTFDPESLALLWFVSLTKTDLKITASNNPRVTPTGQLPALILEDGQHRIGFTDIVEYLLQNSHSTANEDLKDYPLATYCKKLDIVTAWMLFVHKDNYESVTRPAISNIVPFPMQYNLALSLQRAAKAKCEFAGLIGKAARSASAQESNSVLNEEGISKLHTEMLLARNEKEKMLKQTKENMRIAAFGAMVLDTVEQSINGDATLATITPAELLVAAHLQIQTCSELKDSIIRVVLERWPQCQQICRLAGSISLPEINYDAGADANTLTNWIWGLKDYSLSSLLTL